MRKVNVGDKIRVIIPLLTFGKYSKGDVFEVSSVDDEGSVHVVEHDHIILREEYEVLPKYKTENRIAEIGERILITEPDMSFGEYDKGDVLKVIGHYTDDVKDVLAEGIEVFIGADEYEVIIEEKGSEDMTKESACNTIKMTMPDGTVIEGTAESLAEMYKLSEEQAEEDVVEEFSKGDSELEKVEISEVDESFFRAGRSPGELKIGDIVEVTECRSGHPVGTIREVVKVFSLGRGEVKAIYGRSYSDYFEGNLKLIAPADERVDIDA